MTMLQSLRQVRNRPVPTTRPTPPYARPWHQPTNLSSGASAGRTCRQR